MCDFLRVDLRGDLLLRLGDLLLRLGDLRLRDLLLRLRDVLRDLRLILPGVTVLGEPLRNVGPQRDLFFVHLRHGRDPAFLDLRVHTYPFLDPFPQ